MSSNLFISLSLPSSLMNQAKSGSKEDKEQRIREQALKSVMKSPEQEKSAPDSKAERKGQRRAYVVSY